MISAGSAGAYAAEGTAYESIHGDMLRYFGDLVEELGGSAGELLVAAGIDVPHSLPGRIRASYRQFVLLLEHAADRLDCADFGMRLAVRQSCYAYAGPLGDGMRHARDLRDALQFLCSHNYAHSRAAWIWLRPSLSGAHAVLGHDILLDGLPHGRQAIEYILLVGNLATLDLTGGRVRARQALFRHQPLSPMKIYRKYWQCDVRFGRSANAVVYKQEDLDCPVHDPNPEAQKEARTLIESRFIERKPPLHADVRGNIGHLLGIEPCTRERVAQALKLHPRTMLRRLSAEGTSFQQIRDEVRRQRLHYYVTQTGMDFMVISEKLGFAEQAVMSRCCCRWFAMSPSRLRTTAQI